MIRKQWAENHLYWTKEDWEKMLRTVESWINHGWHTQSHIIIMLSFAYSFSRGNICYEREKKVGQDQYESCHVSQHRGRKGWIFRWYFAGSLEGPCIFWDKNKVKIKVVNSRTKIVPVIESVLCERTWLSLKQDNTLPYSAYLTIQKLN